MDAFKQNEILRMQYGGNKAWQDFFTKESGSSFDSVSIKERYDCEVGEEWKERLTAKVEDREFDKSAFAKERAVILQKQAERASTPMGGMGSNTGSRSASPGKPALPPGQKTRNENYFAKMGQANASRSENLAPSQGGKYAGFGSAVPEPQTETAMPSADDFSKDPVAALTKGFGWFSTAVAKQAKVVNESYIQPTAKQVS
jgi:ADP-ribosylation factor GTPase-activating protein 1